MLLQLGECLGTVVARFSSSDWLGRKENQHKDVGEWLKHSCFVHPILSSFNVHHTNFNVINDERFQICPSDQTLVYLPLQERMGEAVLTHVTSHV